MSNCNLLWIVKSEDPNLNYGYSQYYNSKHIPVIRSFRGGPSASGFHEDPVNFHDEDVPNILLNFYYATNENNDLYFSFPKGSWIKIEVSEKRDDTFPGYIRHTVKLNNNVVYTTINYGIDHYNPTNPVEDLSGFSCQLDQYSCVKGFYRNLQVDFGTCGQPGLNELFGGKDCLCRLFFQKFRRIMNRLKMKRSILKNYANLDTLLVQLLHLTLITIA